MTRFLTVPFALTVALSPTGAQHVSVGTAGTSPVAQGGDIAFAELFCWGVAPQFCGASVGPRSVGQQFFAPLQASSLDGMSLWLMTGTTELRFGNFDAYLMSLDSNEILWSRHEILPTRAAMYERHDFALGGIPVHPGGSYLFFLSAIERLSPMPVFPDDANEYWGVEIGATVEPDPTGGGGVEVLIGNWSYTDRTPPSEWTISTSSNANLLYEATFTTTPEPATVLLLTTGLLGIGTAAGRRRRVKGGAAS